MAEPAATLVAPQPRNQTGAMEEAAAATHGVQTEVVGPETSELPEKVGDDPDAEKDGEQPRPPEDSIGVGGGRSSMPSPCGEPRAIEVGGAVQDQSFQ